jgi:hypothetical protein
VQDSAHNHANLFLAVDAVQSPAGASYIPAVEDEIDVEQWTRTFALERCVGNLDCYGNINGQNMYAYRSPSTNRWQLLLYDTELVFNCGGGYDCTNAPLFSNISDPRILALLSTNEFKRAYWRGFSDAINGPMQSSNYASVVLGNYSLLSSNGILKGINLPLAGLSINDVSALTNWIENRRTIIAQQLQTNTAPFVITNATSTSLSSVKLGGTAPLPIKFIRLNARTTNEFLVWGSVTNWTITNPYPLVSGANPITVVGLDRFNNVFATTNITITKQ